MLTLCRQTEGRTNHARSCRRAAADPLLTEGRVAQRVAERGEALVEDLFPVSYEQQARAGKSGANGRVVERRHHGLACPGRGDEKVAVVAAPARELDQLEQPCLERPSRSLTEES